MTKIICQHSGIEFDGSPRAKNHPAIALLLTEANKKNQYGVALDAIREAREAGITDIATFENVVREALKSDRADYVVRAAEWKREREARYRAEMDYRQNQGWLNRPDNQGELETEADRLEVTRKNVTRGESELAG